MPSLAPAPVHEGNSPKGPPYLNPWHFRSGTQLSESNFSIVNGFTCSKPGKIELPFERDVTDWLTKTGRAGAREAIRLGIAEVVAYLNESQKLVGFAAIGQENWQINGRTFGIWLLHYFGVNGEFRSQKETPREERYGRRIMGGIIEEIDLRNEHLFMALYCDIDNPAKTSFYPEFDFKEIDQVEEEGRIWCRMLRRIPTSNTSKPFSEK